MNKVPFVVIGILLLTAVFVAAFSSNEGKNPLAALGDVTPTQALNFNSNQAAQGQQQQAQQQTQQQVQQNQVVPTVATSDIISATMVTIHTAKGDIVLDLYPNDAPKTVQNFATLAKKGYYNGLKFHRVEPGFVIQGGDPNGDGSGRYSIFGPTFADELNPDTESYKAGYQEGVLAMANRGPNTNGSQFFIMLANNDSLPKAYTIFGKVKSGLDVVHKISVGDVMTSVEVNE